MKPRQPGSRGENKEAKENEKEEDVGDFISKEKLNKDDKKVKKKLMI